MDIFHNYFRCGCRFLLCAVKQDTVLVFWRTDSTGLVLIFFFWFRISSAEICPESLGGGGAEREPENRTEGTWLLLQHAAHPKQHKLKQQNSFSTWSKKHYTEPGKTIKFLKCRWRITCKITCLRHLFLIILLHCAEEAWDNYQTQWSQGENWHFKLAGWHISICVFIRLFSCLYVGKLWLWFACWSVLKLSLWTSGLGLTVSIRARTLLICRRQRPTTFHWWLIRRLTEIKCSILEVIKHPPVSYSSCVFLNLVLFLFSKRNKRENEVRRLL